MAFLQRSHLLACTVLDDDLLGDVLGVVEVGGVVLGAGVSAQGLKYRSVRHLDGFYVNAYDAYSA